MAEGERPYWRQLDESARQALELAQDEARRLGHNYVGTEHVLLALTRAPQSEKLLRRLGIEPGVVAERLGTIVGRGDRPASGRIRFAPRTKRSIDLALAEAHQDGSDRLTADDLLLGLVLEGEGIAAGVLRSLGVDPGRVTEAMGKEPRGGEMQTELVAQAPYDRFTERARKVLTLAQEEARRFKHNYIGTEHLLLGLVREGEGVAAKVLVSLGVELERVRTAVEFIIGQGEGPVQGEIGLTPRAKMVIELGVDEARRLGHHYVGTEHLLLGLIREGEGIAAGVLESLGVGLERVRDEILRTLETGRSPRAGSEPVPPRRHEPPVVYAFLYTHWESEGPVVKRAAGVLIAEGTRIEQALAELGRAGWQLGGVDTSREGQALYVLHRRGPMH